MAHPQIIAIGNLTFYEHTRAITNPNSFGSTVMIRHPHILSVVLSIVTTAFALSHVAAQRGDVTCQAPPLTKPYDGQVPQVPSGFTATSFATELANPRRLFVLPNGDVLVAEQVPVT